MIQKSDSVCIQFSSVNSNRLNTVLIKLAKFRNKQKTKKMFAAKLFVVLVCVCASSAIIPLGFSHQTVVHHGHGGYGGVGAGLVGGLGGGLGGGYGGVGAGGYADNHVDYHVS